AGLNKQRAEQPILLNFCSPGNLLFWHVGKVIWRTISQWFYSLMNVCLLITYFSTNNSIIITKREICNFLSQLSLAPAFSSQQTPKKHRNFPRNFLEKLPRNQEFQAANILKNVLPEAQKDTPLQRQKLHTLWIIVIKRHVPMFSCYIDCCH